MANAITHLTITHSAKVPVASVSEKLAQPSTSPRDFVMRLVNLLTAFVAGLSTGSIIFRLENASNTTKASTTGTFTGDATANDTITIGGRVLTWKASAGNENEITIPATGAANMAAALVAAINANSELKGIIVASNVLGVVTFEFFGPGRMGNLIVLAESTSNFTLAATRLAGAGGTQQVSNVTYDFGGVA